MPLSEEDHRMLEVPKRNLIIICSALIAGVLSFGIVLCAIIDFNNLHTELKMLVAMAAGFGAVMFMSSLVAFKVLSVQTHARSKSVLGHFGALQSAWIVQFAMIEGACLLNLIVTMLENSLITLFVFLVGVLMMVIWFPRPIRVEELLEERMRH